MPSAETAAHLSATSASLHEQDLAHLTDHI